MINESPLLQSRIGCAAVTAFLCLGIGIRVANLNIVTGRSPDETNYTLQAQTLLKNGNGGLRAIAEEYLRDPAARLAGPPTRAGYLWMLAATMRYKKTTDASAGAAISCAASIGSLLLLAWIGIRFFPAWAALFAVLSFAVSPFEMEIARRAWIDSLVGFLGLALVYLACELTVNPERRLWQALFFVTGAIGIVVKEFGPVVLAMCAAWVFWVITIQRKDYRNGLLFAGGVVVAMAASVSWIAHSIGGFGVLIETVRDWLSAHRANAYAIEYQSGPGYLLMRAFKALSPAPAFFCVVGLAAALLPSWPSSVQRNGEGNRKVGGWMAVSALGYLAFPMFLPHWLNLRYVSVLFAPFYLLAGLGFWYVASSVWNRSGPAARGAIAVVAIVGAAESARSDYRRFDRFFVDNGVGDLSVKLILDRADLPVAERLAKRRPTAENYFNLCKLYDRNWRYIDAIGACKRATELKPDYAEAYNGLAAAYMNLELWDEAIPAAEKAVRLNPDLPNSRENLKRSIHEKGLRD